MSSASLASLGASVLLLAVQVACNGSGQPFPNNACLWALSPQYTGQCVTSTGGSLTLAPCSGYADQLWVVQDSQLVAQSSVGGQQACLTVSNYVVGYPASLILWPCTGTTTQLWQVNQQFRADVQWKGGDLCLDVNGPNIVAIPCSATTAQWLWDCQTDSADCQYTEWVSWSTCDLACGGGVRTRNRDVVYGWSSDLCTDTADTCSCNPNACCQQAQASCLIVPTTDIYQTKCLSYDATHAVTMEPCTGQNAELWSLQGGQLSSGQQIGGQAVCVTVDSDLVPRMWPCAGQTAAQQFTRYGTAFVNPATGLCLTVLGGLNQNEPIQPMTMEPCTGSAAQSLTFSCNAIFTGGFGMPYGTSFNNNPNPIYTGQNPPRRPY